MLRCVVGQSGRSVWRTIRCDRTLPSTSSPLCTCVAQFRFCSSTKAKSKPKSPLSETETQPVVIPRSMPMKEEWPRVPASLVPTEIKSVAKGIMINKFDKQNMVYPEFPDIESYKNIASYAKDLERIIQRHGVEPSIIDKEEEIPSDFIAELKRSGVFGLAVSEEYGGYDVTNKARCRVADVLGADLNTSLLVNSHELVCRAISEYGTEGQKRRYLSRLATGQSVGAMCLYEDSCGEDIASMATLTQSVESDPDVVSVSGMKDWVINGHAADIILLFAKRTNPNGDDFLTAFIVDKNQTAGVSVVERQHTIGLRGVPVWKLKFDKVHLGSKSVLGSVDGGFKIADQLMQTNRYSLAAALTNFLRGLTESLTRFCNETERFGKLLSSHATTKRRMGTLTVNTYVLESMAYYVAGMLDEDQERVMDAENLILHRFAVKAMRDGIISAMQIVGAAASTRRFEFERMLRDATTLSGLLMTDDVVTERLALLGLTAWAAEYPSRASKVRNYRKNPWFVSRVNLSRAKLNAMFDVVNREHYIDDYAHPSLERACIELDKSMTRIEIIMLYLLERYGQEIEDEPFILEEMADMTTRVFSSLAAIARASRGYSVGLKNCELELEYAHQYAHRCARKVKEQCRRLSERRGMTTEYNTNRYWSNEPYNDLLDRETVILTKAADRTFEKGGYRIDNPLERNW